MKRTQTAAVEKEKEGILSRISENGRKEIIKSALAAVFGAIFAGAGVAQGLSPFGVSLVAALKGKYGFFALLGAGFGYFAQGFSDGSVRYIAEILIVAAIKWAFAAFFDGENRWSLPTVTAAVNLAVGAAVLFTYESTVYDVLFLISECVICGGAVYFIARLCEVFEKGGALQNAENVVALSVCAALSLISLSQIVVGFISVGHVIAAIVIMAMSYSLGTLGGACAGLAIGAALSVQGADGGFFVMALGLGGMLSGLFSALSRYAVAILFLLCTVLSVSVVGADSQQLYFVYEALVAAIVFLFTPQRTLKLLGYYFPGTAGGEYYPNRYLASRLSFVSKALSETSQSLCEMSDKLVQKNGNDMDKVFSSAADRVCRRCGMKLNCWDSAYSDTMDSFNHMIPALRRSGRIEPENVPDLLRRRCTKMTQLISEINGAYHRSCADAQAAQRSRQLKDVVTEQFGGISKLLCEMSQELSLTMCDRETEGRISGSLAREGIEVRDVSCPVDRFGRKTVEFYCLSDDAEKIDGSQLCESISEICGTPMLQGSLFKTEDLTRLTFSERPPYNIEIGSFQKKAQGEKVCGDSFMSLSLHNGFSAVILSDGMGHGRSAALDSKMTVSLVSRFLGLGFSVENCVSLVNSALMLKSEDETLSTLDAAVFDLYSASVLLKKAGAAPSYLRRGKRVSKVEMGSLPLGILGTVRVRGAELRLSRGDVVVMGSDGLCALSDNQIESILRKNADKTPQQLAELLGESAAKSDSKAAEDDITVVVIQME